MGRAHHLPAQMIEYHHIGICVIKVIGIGWVVLFCPVPRQGAVQVKDVVLWLRFIIHTVKAIHLPSHMPGKERDEDEKAMSVFKGLVTSLI